MTRGAEHFIKKETFVYLGAEAAYSWSEDFTPRAEGILHIELARWCDTFVVAPLSANTLSSLAHAQANDLLCSIFLAMGNDQKSRLYFPAMNTKMHEHPLVQKNLQTLKELPNTYIHPTSVGLLACGEQGEGKLAPVEEIASLIETLPFSAFNTQNQQSFLITTGATIAPLDPVRYMTNSSSGMTGLYLAQASLKLGHKVKVIAGKHATSKLDELITHPNFSLERVTTNEEMRESVLENFNQSDFYISSAAISDFKFSPNDGKMKKKDISGHLEIFPDNDILKDVIALKKKHIIVGFAAETNLSAESIKEKLERKPVDLLIGTLVHNGLVNQAEQKGFGADHAHYLIVEENDGQRNFNEMTLKKDQLANLVIETCLKKYQTKERNKTAHD